MKIKNFFINASPYLGWLGIVLVMASLEQSFQETFREMVCILIMPVDCVLVIGLFAMAMNHKAIPKKLGPVILYCSIFLIGVVASIFSLSR